MGSAISYPHFYQRCVGIISRGQVNTSSQSDILTWDSEFRPLPGGPIPSEALCLSQSLCGSQGVIYIKLPTKLPTLSKICGVGPAFLGERMKPETAEPSPHGMAVSPKSWWRADSRRPPRRTKGMMVPCQLSKAPLVFAKRISGLSRKCAAISQASRGPRAARKSHG